MPHWRPDCGGALGWLSARLVGQNRLVTEGGIIVAVTLLLTGTIWLVQQQIDESVLQVRQSLREAFYPQEIEQERRQKKQQLVEERNALRETLSAPVSREQASGDLLAEIADIHDMAISRDANTLYAAIENTNSIVVFDLGQKKILHTFTAPIAKEKSVKHCGGCKDQGVRSLALSRMKRCCMRLHLKRMHYRSLTWQRGDYSVDYHRRTS